MRNSLGFINRLRITDIIKILWSNQNSGIISARNNNAVLRTWDRVQVTSICPFTPVARNEEAATLSGLPGL